MPVEVKKTLVKSRPELWAEVSDPGTLARHLAVVGSIRITRVQPESAVDWEGERASGSVRLEPSGFGTRVTFTAVPHGATATPDPGVAAPDATPGSGVAVAPDRRSFWARLLRRPVGAVEPEPEPAPAPVRTLEEDRLQAVLGEVIEVLGTAHHRPFSRV